ncbi:alpha/beta hydrolase [Larkinella humicola]|uniref:Esterase family protein n=1 Tax=Larkinella humicola TaxID=2607654 RepID=A0A5N1JK38_9BACT|nr:alpha/beta hydrolase-fold protein [Larkinella humicola]KAA9356524.1 esterase family protein [Larkinella humicola]
MRFLWLICLLVSWSGYAQESRVFDDLTIKSTLLKKDKKFALYLPPGYETSQRAYPVLYLLHGGGDDQTAWLQSGNMQAIVDKEIKEGRISPMIVVMPDAEMTFYMNNVAGKYQYEDYFMKELIPFIEKTYRCRTEKRFRAVAGLSMGGFGSLLYAMHHPDLFGSCAALSSGVRTDQQIKEMPHQEYLRRYRSTMGELKEGENRITEYWNQNSILYLVQKMPEAQKKAVRFYLDCGDDDLLLYRGNSDLHSLMRDVNIPHEYRVRNGGHTWEYWRTGLPDALQFINQSFQ